MAVGDPQTTPESSTGLADLSAAVGPEESENSFQKSCPSRAAAGCATCEAKVPIPGLHACPVGSGRRPDLRREPALSRPNNQIYGGGNSVSWAGKRIQPGRPELGVHIRSWLSYARGGRRSPSRRLYSPAAGQPLNRGRALRSRFRSPARRERRAQEMQGWQHSGGELYLSVLPTTTTPGSPRKRGAFSAERFRGVDLQIACLGVAQQGMDF